MRRVAVSLTLVLLAGCGAMRDEAPSEPEYAGSREYAGDAAAPAPTPFFGEDADEEAKGALAMAPQQPNGGPPPAGNPAPDGQQGQGGGQNGQNGQAGPQDPQAPSTPILIYTADLHLAVHEVESTQRAVVTIAKELGGYLAYQDDSRVTVRVPAKRFQDAIERLERVGDVVHRNIQAQDVTEEFRDVSIRLRNAEVVRGRLEELLARAEKVEDAMKVQAELARVTEQIETLKGRLRFLQDRVSYSTITVHFQPKPSEQIGQPEVYRLPFPWLDELGLPALLNLR